MNEYSALRQDSTSVYGIAESASAACKLMDTAVDNPIVTLQRIKTGLVIEPKLINVKFMTEVTPPEAAVAGCKATPEVYVVVENTPVVFSAIEAPGFTFKEWSKDTLSISTKSVDSFIVTPAVEPSSLAVTYTAVFVPTP